MDPGLRRGGAIDGTGTLLGIARHAFPRGPMETVEAVEVGLGFGIHGDFRGSLKPGRNKRQVTVMTTAAWQAALAEIDQPVAWEQRRVNLIVDGLDIENSTGARILFEGGAILEVTGECDPCSRMEEVAPGLKAALLPHWRGGVCTKVIANGFIALGHHVRIER
jgi:MOSC domain-containing protein YiiM